jgi:PEP-CTERM motif
MKKTVILSLCSFATLLAFQTVNAQTIAQWTHETIANTNGMNLAPGAGNSPGTIQADNGLNYNVSRATGLHATAATYSFTAGDLDPAIAALAPGASGPGLPGSSLANVSPSSHSFSANNWSVGDYWSFTTSTLGFTDVSISWDQTGSNTGPANFGLSYSINGGAFTPATTYTLLFNSWNATTALGNSLTFAGGGAFDNATTITFELVDLNTVSVNGGTVAATGTDRVDNFTVVVPEPSTIALAMTGLAGLLALRRRRS